MTGVPDLTASMPEHQHRIPVAGSNRAVARWLFVCCALVFAMVVLGGVTRLTGSGLSIVDWRPVVGWLPPLTDAEWERVFEMYRQTPEFLKVNPHFDVHGFKEIYWLEYFHRLLGRSIGIVFVLPFFYFAVRGYIRRRDWPKYVLMFLLGGLQGVLGWYMVKSGLVDDPRVSQYRLAAHLVAAFLIYAFMFWVALTLVNPRREGRHHRWFGRTVGLTAWISLTIVSGAFVAGLRAGKFYNTFPKMNEHWIPPELMAQDPWWRNFFDNVTTVQFDHRVFAIATLVLIAAYWIRARNALLSARSRLASNLLLFAVLAQVSLGIATLVLGVPVPLAAAHQAVAMLLFTASLYLVHSLR